MSKLKLFFKQMFCRHDYQVTYEKLIGTNPKLSINGSSISITGIEMTCYVDNKCSKCGKNR